MNSLIKAKELCVLCDKVVASKPNISCDCCHKLTHLGCIGVSRNVMLNSYYCLDCTTSCFPFNHILGNDEFINTLMYFFLDFPMSCNYVTINGVNRLNAYSDTVLTASDNADPDVHLYNPLLTDTKYFLPSELKNTLRLQKFSSSLSLLHINARSMLNKINSIEFLINSISFDFNIIAITETWETESNSSLLKLPGFVKVSKARKNNENGGGVALFLKEDLKFIQKDIITDSFESLFIDVIDDSSSRPTLVGVIYRPPNTDLRPFNAEIEKTLSGLTSKKNSCILAGDYNINLLNHTSSTETNNFINVLFSHQIIPQISRPTRISDHSATLIDNVLTNQLEPSSLSGIIITDISDHLPIFYIPGKVKQKIKYKKKTYIYKQVQCFDEASVLSFAQKLDNTNWPIPDEHDASLAFNNFNSVFSALYNDSFPTQTKKYKLHYNSFKPWITNAILKSIKHKNKLYKNYLNKRTLESKVVYIKYRNKLTTVIRNSEKLYHANSFEAAKGNARETWKLISKILCDTCGFGSKPKITEIVHNNQTITAPADIANKFNDFFANIGCDLAKKIPDVSSKSSILDTMPAPNCNSIFLLPCTPTEIIDIANKLANSNSTGLDGFKAKIVKNIISLVATPLSDIFNISFQNGIFPEILKNAKVTPIHKTDDKHLINNYRPISVLPFFSKILEKLMYTRVMQFVDKHKILSDNQYGFREKHSTYMALINMIDQISSEMDNKKFSIGIFLDLSKAFDTIDHNILLQKLEIYGIRGTALCWFNSYLANRKQCVVVNGEYSQHLTISCGVPQGSILGPLLFLLYINDLTHSTAILKFVMFADDTNLFFSHKDLNELTNIVNCELNKISLWLKINKLSLNIKKTHFILFHFRQKKIITSVSIQIDNNNIEQVKMTKFLGIIINENLTWSDHIETVANKCSKNIGIIRKLRKTVPSNVLVTLYYTLIYPYLNYCNIAWASHPTLVLDKLYRTQKRQYV